MPSSTLVLDSFRLREWHDGNISVEQVSHYPSAYLALRKAVHGGSPVEIIVHDRTAAEWLRRAAAAYGPEHVELVELTPRALLADRWGIAVPADVSDHVILRSGLLDELGAVRAGQSFWDAVLERFYGPALTYKTFPVGDLLNVVDALRSARAKGLNNNPLAARALSDRLEQWARTAGSEALKALNERLRHDPEVLRKDLVLFRTLQNYPAALGEKVLSDTWQMLIKVRIDVQDIKLTRDDLHAVPPDVEYYLTEALNKARNAADLGTLLEQVSGHLVSEFSTVEALIQKHPDWLTTELLRDIERRFRPIQSGISSAMAKLRRLLPPPFPTAPSTDWSAAEWLEWVRGSYMPYYAWLDNQSKRDDMVFGYALVFADWFGENFLKLKNNEAQAIHFAYAALYGERDLISAPGTVALALILDNVNFAYFDDLCRLFNQRGFSLEDSRPVFSLLPTATEVCKGGLIAGRGDQVDIPAESYPQLVKEEWGPILHGKRAAYLPNVGELQQLRTLDADLYFLNYLPTDKVLHEDNRDTGRAHSDMMHDALEALADAVAEFARRFSIERRLIVYAVSDHGSTRIPQGTVNVLDKAFFKSLALDKHHRYIALSDDRFTQLPQVASVQCYPIDRQHFKTNKNYLAAREYYRFADTTENFYVHGGLSPEEVVVPFARFTRKPPAPVPPTLRLQARQFRYEVRSKLNLEVGNPNAYPLESVNVRLLNVAAEDATLDMIAPKQSLPLEIPVVFKKKLGTGQLGSITVRVRYVCQGMDFGPVDETFDITMKSLIEEADDDFDL